MKKTNILLIIILFFITGCYDYRELNNLEIVTAISISKDKNNYITTVQIANQSDNEDNPKRFITYTSHGKTIQKSLRNITKQSPKKIYLNQMQIMIIDENIAKEGINYILDFFGRNSEIRNNFYILISKDTNILETLSNNNISSQNITESLISNNKYLGLTKLVTFNELLTTIIENKKEITLPSIKLNNNKSVIIDAIALFKNNKLIGYLNNDESIALNFITNNIDDILITNNYNNEEYITTEVITSTTKTKVKNNIINITITGTSKITEINSSLDLTDFKNITKVENKLNKNIKKMIKNSIKEINKKYSSDIYGFKELFFKNNSKYYNKIKNKDDKYFLNNLEINIKCKIKIIEQGNILGGINNE